MRIEPTVCQTVLYHPGEAHPDYGHTLAATIAKVNPDGTINIGVLDCAGHHFSRSHVQLVQADEVAPPSHYCELMIPPVLHDTECALKAHVAMESASRVPLRPALAGDELIPRDEGRLLGAGQVSFGYRTPVITDE